MMMRIRLRWAIILLVPVLWIGCGEKAIKLSLKFKRQDNIKIMFTCTLYLQCFKCIFKN